MFDKQLVGILYNKVGLLSPGKIGLVNHMFGVSIVAGFLARKLLDADISVNVGMAETAAAIHDIGKVFDEGSPEHIIKGVEFLREQGIDEGIIRIVERHEVYSFKENETPPDPATWEEKLVFLADLSFSGNIVPIEERVEDIISRYPGIRKKWLREKSQEIYSKILAIVSPQTLPF